MAADPSMRALLERDRGLLRWIVKTAPAAFWIAARHLKVDKDRIVVPGGAAAEPIWEALVEVKVTRPADFLRALLARDSGRLAWFYDSIGAMSPERVAAAFGAPPIEAQIEEARAFYGAFRSADSNWKLEEHPFLRGTTDPWIVASQIGRRRRGRRAARRAVVLGGAVRPIRDRAPLGGVGAARAGDAGHARVDRAEDLERVGQGTARSIRDGALRAGRLRQHRRRSRRRRAGRARRISPLPGDPAVARSHGRHDAARLRAAGRSGPAARRGVVGPRREACGDRVSVGAGDPRARAADAARSTSRAAETLLLSLADAVDPPVAQRKTRPFTADHAVDADDAARRAAAAGAAGSVDGGEDGVRIAIPAGAGRPAVGSRCAVAHVGGPRLPRRSVRRGAAAPQSHPRADRIARARRGAGGR